MEIIAPDDLSDGWQTELTYIRRIGEEWFDETRSLALGVPTVILPESTNVLLKPYVHGPTSSSLRPATPFKFDTRLRST